MHLSNPGKSTDTAVSVKRSLITKYARRNNKQQIEETFDSLIVMESSKMYCELCQLNAGRRKLTSTRPSVNSSSWFTTTLCPTDRHMSIQIDLNTWHSDCLELCFCLRSDTEIWISMEWFKSRVSAFKHIQISDLQIKIKSKDISSLNHPSDDSNQEVHSLELFKIKLRFQICK